MNENDVNNLSAEKKRLDELNRKVSNIESAEAEYRKINEETEDIIARALEKKEKQFDVNDEKIKLLLEQNIFYIKEIKSHNAENRDLFMQEFRNKKQLLYDERGECEQKINSFKLD